MVAPRPNTVLWQLSAELAGQLAPTSKGALVLIFKFDIPFVEVTMWSAGEARDQTCRPAVANGVMSEGTKRLCSLGSRR